MRLLAVSIIIGSTILTLLRGVSSFHPKHLHNHCYPSHPSTRTPQPSWSSRCYSIQKDVLIPQENPDIDPTTTVSQSGVLYGDVLHGISNLYPPQALEERNAASRTDGYWPYIQQGQDPPKQFTYGEFDFLFFASLLDQVVQNYVEDKGGQSGWNNKVFVDIGSGTGRLVLGAAALHPGFQKCRGIEILQGISNVAQSKLEACCDDITIEEEDKEEDDEDDDDEWVENQHGLLVKKETASEADDEDIDVTADTTPTTYSLKTTNEDDNNTVSLPLAPVEFVCGSFEDPYLYFGDANVVFCFSSCMSTSILTSLSQAIGRQCRPGTTVITTDFSLELEGTIPPFQDDNDYEDIDDDDDNNHRIPHGDYALELLDRIDGYCWLTGGTSTAYIHRVVTSLWDGSGPKTRPIPSPSQKAFKAIHAMEANREEAALRFLSGVRNNMVFAGFPERWWPNPENYKTSQHQ